MNYKELPLEIRWAVDAVRRATELGIQIQSSKNVESLQKQDDSPVTVADFSIQTLIASCMAKELPEGVLLAEEGVYFLQSEKGLETLSSIKEILKPELGTLSDEEIINLVQKGSSKPNHSFWTLDPIDGTRGFVRGDCFAVALAWIHEGEVKASIVGYPDLKTDVLGRSHPASIVIAFKDFGSWKAPLSDLSSWHLLKVSDKEDASKGIVLRSFEQRHTNISITDKILEILNIHQPAICLDSLAKFALVAEGIGDLLCRFPSPKKQNYKENIWDIASGALIVEEAGGKVTDVYGNKLDFSCGVKLSKNTGVVATNGHLHPKLLEATKEAFEQLNIK